MLLAACLPHTNVMCTFCCSQEALKGHDRNQARLAKAKRYNHVISEKSDKQHYYLQRYRHIHTNHLWLLCYHNIYY
jgi:hypothetical protein